MPESTCLHIQDRESAPIRVVEIPWISVRIGRAVYCEVRLTDRDVAEEACRLQRRGGTGIWSPRSEGVDPVSTASPSKASVLSLRYSLPIGGCCLTLRRSRSSDPDWAMYQSPSPSQGEWTPSARPDGPIRQPGARGRADHAFTAAAGSGLPPPMARAAIRSPPPRPPKVSSPPRLEPAPGRTAGPESVNPWEAPLEGCGRSPSSRPRTAPSHPRGLTDSSPSIVIRAALEGIVGTASPTGRAPGFPGGLAAVDPHPDPDGGRPGLSRPVVGPFPTWTPSDLGSRSIARPLILGR